jgi:AraC-like DNA-binding protein
MRSKKNVETTILEVGETLKKDFDNYVVMAENAVDWTLFCSYQLKPNFSEGIYKILQLPSMQIAYTNMEGGIMFDYVAPEECITFSLMKNISQKACIDEMKLETGMIAIVNDKKIYNFMCSAQVEIVDISLNKNANPRLLKKLTQAIDKYYIDTDLKITTLIKGFITEFSDCSRPIDTQISMEIEKQITEAMLKLLDVQEAQTPHFTKSEKTSLKIKKDLFKHMDHTMSVETLAKKYTISVKSLENAFKSLYGIRPNKFMRLLKLNLVHHELVQSKSSQTSVSKVAQKWGFVHMGRFSKFYTELFGENPSISLKNTSPVVVGMDTHCVERKEEIDEYKIL